MVLGEHGSEHGSEHGRWRRVAVADQWQAARREAREVVASVSESIEVTVGDDDALSAAVEARVRSLCFRSPESGSVCPHVTSNSILAAPRAVVLDVSRDLLACLGECYAGLAATQIESAPDAAACLRCGRPGCGDDDGFVLAQGAVVVLAYVCPACHESLDASAYGAVRWVGGWRT